MQTFKRLFSQLEPTIFWSNDTNFIEQRVVNKNNKFEPYSYIYPFSIWLFIYIHSLFASSISITILSLNLCCSVSGQFFHYHTYMSFLCFLINKLKKLCMGWGEVGVGGYQGLKLCCSNSFEMSLGSVRFFKNSIF